MLTGLAGAKMYLEKSVAGPDEPTPAWPGGLDIDPAIFEAIVKTVLNSRRPVVKSGNTTVLPKSAAPDLIGCPIVVDDQLCGVFVARMNSASQTMQQTTVRQILNHAKWLGVLIDQDKSSSSTPLNALFAIVAQSLGTDSFLQAVQNITDRIERLFDCRQVSIGLYSSKKIKIKAISQTRPFDREAGLIKAMADAMNEAADQAQAVVWPNENPNDITVNKFHEHLAAGLNGASLCSIPMVHHGKIIGVLLLARHSNKNFDDLTIDQCMQISQLLGDIVYVLQKNEQSPAAKILDSATNFFKACFGPGHPALKSAAMLIIVLSALLFFTKTEFRILADSEIEAGTRRAVIAPQNGFIAQAAARAGDIVQKGALLAGLEDRELKQERRKRQTQRSQIIKEYRKSLALSDRAEVAILKAKIAQAEAQLNLVEQQLQRTRLVAPVSGLVVAGDLSQSIGAPVERGDILFEVAPAGDYRVVLHIADRDIGLVHEGQNGHLKLSAHPDTIIPIVVKRLLPVSVAENGENYFRVEAQMNTQTDMMRPGMSGIAKIDVGKHRLLWILSRDFANRLRMTAWTYLP